MLCIIFSNMMYTASVVVRASLKTKKLWFVQISMKSEVKIYTYGRTKSISNTFFVHVFNNSNSNNAWSFLQMLFRLLSLDKHIEALKISSARPRNLNLFGYKRFLRPWVVSSIHFHPAFTFLTNFIEIRFLVKLRRRGVILEEIFFNASSNMSSLMHR